jgi:hypothetical protein
MTIRALLLSTLAVAPWAALAEQTRTDTVLLGLQDPRVPTYTGAWYGSVVGGDATATTYAYHCGTGAQFCNPQYTTTMTAGPSTCRQTLRISAVMPASSTTSNSKDATSTDQTDDLTAWVELNCDITKSKTAACTATRTVALNGVTESPKTESTTITRNEIQYAAITVTAGLDKVVSTGAAASKPTKAPALVAAAGLAGLGLGALQAL